MPIAPALLASNSRVLGPRVCDTQAELFDLGIE